MKKSTLLCGILFVGFINPGLASDRRCKKPMQVIFKGPRAGESVEILAVFKGIPRRLPANHFLPMVFVQFKQRFPDAPGCRVSGYANLPERFTSQSIENYLRSNSLVLEYAPAMAVAVPPEGEGEQVCMVSFGEAALGLTLPEGSQVVEKDGQNDVFGFAAQWHGVITPSAAAGQEDQK